MVIKYLSQSCFLLQHEDSSLIFDPWFFDSTPECPLVRGILPSQQTLDFKESGPTFDISQIKVDAILLSSFEATKAPAREIKMLLEQTPTARPKLFTPPITSEKTRELVESLGPLASRTEIHSLNGAEVTHTFGPWTVSIFVHPISSLAIYLVRCSTSSFLHICDSPANRNQSRRELDPLFIRFRDLSPTFFALTACGANKKIIDGNTKKIIEDFSMSPPEAARLVAYIKPKMTGVMDAGGLRSRQNNDVFKLPPEFVEDFFAWAIGKITQDVLVTLLRTGLEIDLSIFAKEVMTAHTSTAPMAS